MACATLFHRSNNKRSIDYVEPDQSAGPPLCKRNPAAELNLTPASFGSPPRTSRNSPLYSLTGRSSPKPPSPSHSKFSPPLTHSSSSPSFSRLSESTCDVVPAGELPSRSKSASPDREAKFTAQQVVDIIRHEVDQLDNRLRQEYEQALQDKLQEQYQSFMQFAQEQLQINLQGPPAEMDVSYIL